MSFWNKLFGANDQSGAQASQPEPPASIAEAKRLLETCKSRKDVIAGLNRIVKSGLDIASVANLASTQLQEDKKMDALEQRDFIVAILTGLLVRRASSGLSSVPLCTIHDAARDGDLEKVKVLLKSNPDLALSKDSQGCTALHCAMDKRDNKPVVELLLASNAEVNAKFNNGFTPLHLAAVGGQKDVVELLIKNKADVNANDNDGLTPLHIAAAKGYSDVVELLLTNKAVVNAKATNGTTPLG